MGEHLVPLQRENWGFWDRQKEVFGDMFKDKDDEWSLFDKEIERMKKEMFTLTPMDFGGMSDFGDMGGFGDLGKSLGSSSTSKTTTTSTSIKSSTSSTNKSSTQSTTSTSSTITSSTKQGAIGSGNTDAMSMMIKPERPIIADADGNKRLSLRFDCKQFKPEEITVKTINNKLMVHAKHTEESPGRKVYREFTRQYVLPEKIDPMTLNSILAADGVLSIEAPAPASIEAPRERLLPIKRL